MNRINTCALATARESRRKWADVRDESCDLFVDLSILVAVALPGIDLVLPVLLERAQVRRGPAPWYQSSPGQEQRRGG